MEHRKRILVTGGAGYIGSHTCKLLAINGMEPIAYDNLSNGFRHNVKWGPLVVGDIRDRICLKETFSHFKPDAVIHFAALAYVGDSMTGPSQYYDINVAGCIALLSEMLNAGIDKFVFSSSCATYGIPSNIPISESERQDPINPYGATKLMVERILQDYHQAYGMNSVSLRYFNASGADLEGILAEEHNPETHLIPRCLQAAAGLIEVVDIFGYDYPTHDGTCIRDYIHVYDLARAHYSAIEYLQTGKKCRMFNLGTGTGTSVREILSAVHSVTGKRVPVTFAPRRPGDPPILLADPTLAEKVLGFTTQHSDLKTIIETAWQRYANM